MSDPAWKWDSNKQAYYRWSASDLCYIYQDGTRSYPQQQQTSDYQTGTGSAADSNELGLDFSSFNLGSEPQPSGYAQTGQPSGYAQTGQSSGYAQTGQLSSYAEGQISDYEQTGQSSGYGYTGQPSGYGSAGQPSGYGATVQSSGYGSTGQSSGYGSTGQPSAYASTGHSNLAFGTQAYGTAAQQYQHQAGSQWPMSQQSQIGYGALQTGPQEEIVDPELYKQGARVRGKINGTPGEVETLNKNFYKRASPRKFFKVGKVIRLLWSEQPGNITEAVTIVSDGRFEGEDFISKVRWFVVVKEDKNWCTCLPISTYGGRGLTKPGTAKWQHCIVYSGKDEPTPYPGELPGEQEYGMMSSIRVKPNDKREKMDIMSRINFAKMYTVEHSVKVYDFGNVQKEDLSKLTAQWRRVLDYDIRGNSNTRVQEAQEEDEEEDEEEEVEPSILPLHGTAIYGLNEDGQNPGQLSFRSEERIYVTEYSAETSWGRGRNEKTRQEGTFPINYVRLDFGDHATAKSEYASKDKSHLKIRAKDRIVDITYVNADWDKGRNKRTEKTGIYPQSYVQMNRGNFAKAICEYAYDASNLDQLVIQAGDRILVTRLDYLKGWSWGRNERTREEGRFPTSYVQFNT